MQVLAVILLLISQANIPAIVQGAEQSEEFPNEIQLKMEKTPNLKEVSGLAHLDQLPTRLHYISDKKSKRYFCLDDAKTYPSYAKWNDYVLAKLPEKQQVYFISKEVAWLISHYDQQVSHGEMTEEETHHLYAATQLSIWYFNNYYYARQKKQQPLADLQRPAYRDYLGEKSLLITGNQVVSELIKEAKKHQQDLAPEVVFDQAQLVLKESGDLPLTYDESTQQYVSEYQVSLNQSKMRTSQVLDESHVSYNQLQVTIKNKEKDLTHYFKTQIDEDGRVTMSIDQKNYQRLYDDHELNDLNIDLVGQVSVSFLETALYQSKETTESQPVATTVRKVYLGEKKLTLPSLPIEGLGKVTLTKVATENNQKYPLANAVFDLMQEEKVMEADLKTNEQGEIQLEHLRPGTYQFVETKAPPGYKLDKTPVSFTIKAPFSEWVEVEKNNQLILGQVTLEKTGEMPLLEDETEEGQLPLEGVIFNLYQEDGSLLSSDLTTDNKGRLQVSQLPIGSYYFKEIKTLEGYELVKDKISFTIKDTNQESLNPVVKVTNQLKTGGVHLVKYDHVSKDFLDGAEFNLIGRKGIIVEKNLKVKKGHLYLTGLRPGRYQFVETKAPVGYQLDATPIKFIITSNQKRLRIVGKSNQMLPGSVVLNKLDEDTKEGLAGAEFKLLTASNKVIHDKLVTDDKGQIQVEKLRPGKYKWIETSAPTGYQLNEVPHEFTIEFNQEAPLQLTVTNHRLYGGVRLVKTDEETGEGLAGAVFNLLNEKKEPLQAGLVTNALGEILIDQLLPGQYYFEETKAPDGYQIKQTLTAFTIGKEANHLQQVSVTNQMKSSGLMLVKRDSVTGESLAGAIFKLETAKGKVINEQLVTNENGLFRVNRLRPGNYRLTEIKAPAGYQLAKKPIKFSMPKRQDDVVLIEAYNDLQESGVVLTKQDKETKVPLAGGVFRLETNEGEIIQQGLETDDSGRLAVDHLRPGKYQFIETNAPIGYELDQTPIPFRIKRGQKEAVTLTVMNQGISGSAKLIKRDQDTGEPLANSIFKLETSKGELVDQGLTTDSTGWLTTGELSPGDYQLIETHASEGYVLDATPVTFTIEKGVKAPVELTKLNKMATGGALLTKRDSETGELLAGAIFNLETWKGEVIQRQLVTNEVGEVAVAGLKPGKYRWVETKAPAGYELVDKPVYFYVKKNQTELLQVDCYNELKESGLQIIKRDSETGEGLAGAVFAIYNRKGELVDQGLETNQQGIVYQDHLAPGLYTLKETKAPTGYQLDETVTTFRVKRFGEELVVVERFNQLIQTGAILVKQDSETGQGLPEAVFELQTSQGHVLQSGLVTDQRGYLEVASLKPGSYQLVETKAPVGYQLDQKPVTFTIKKGQNKVIQLTKFNQEISGGFVFKKLNEDNEVLAGAVFRLETSEGKVLEQGLTTDESGQFSKEEMKPGTYQLVETYSPPGYVKDSPPLTFTISNQGDAPVLLEKVNQSQTGGVVLTKKDHHTNESLGGGVFNLLTKQGKMVYQHLTTDDYGRVYVNDLKPGDYQFVEVVAPLGYELNETPVFFTIPKNQTQVEEVNFFDEAKEQGVLITKIDKVTGETLAGAVFDVLNYRGEIVHGQLVTDSQGKISLDNLLPGFYYLQEVKAPAGYELDKEVTKFYVKKEQTDRLDIQLVNQKMTHGVMLFKQDSKTGQGLSGAVFELQDATGKPLQSGLVTDQRGYLSMESLENGQYQLVETTSPTGYELDQTPVTFTVSDDQPELISLSMTNHKQAGGVILTKKDSVTGEKLAGAVFNLETLDGKVLREGLMTDDTGQVALANLKTGSYQLVETKAPVGYVDNQVPLTFEIKKSQTKVVELTKYNDVILGGLGLTKREKETGKVLPGAVFELRQKQGKVIREKLVTNQQGWLEVLNLEPGSYELIEKEAPEGYILDSKPISVLVEKNSPMVKVEKYNELAKDSVVLLKQDSQTKEALAGAVFELQDETGKVLKEKLVTSSSGQLILRNLAAAKYQLVETKAPTGYILDQTPLTFEVAADQTKAVQLTKENTPKQSGVMLEKYDSRYQKLLAGAVFDLKNSQGKVVKKELKTDKSGVIYVKDLAAGDYQFIETKAPVGYQLDSTPVPVSIQPQAVGLVTVRKTNKLLTEKPEVPKPNPPASSGGGSTSTSPGGSGSTSYGKYLPKTNEIVTPFASLFGCVLLGIGLLIKKKKD